MQYRVSLLTADGSEKQLDCQTFKGFAYRKAWEYQLQQLTEPQERRAAQRAAKGLTNEEKFQAVKAYVASLGRVDIGQVIVVPFQRQKTMEELKKDQLAKFERETAVNAGLTSGRLRRSSSRRSLTTNSYGLDDIDDDAATQDGPSSDEDDHDDEEYFDSSRRRPASVAFGLGSPVSPSSLGAPPISEQEIIDRMRKRPRRQFYPNSDQTDMLQLGSAAGDLVASSFELGIRSGGGQQQKSSTSSQSTVRSIYRRPKLIPLTPHLLSKTKPRFYRRTW